MFITSSSRNDARMIGVLAVAVIAVSTSGLGVASAMPAAASPAVPGIDDDVEELSERAGKAATVLEEIMDAPDKGVPNWILEESHCVAVIPKVVKAGFIVAGRRGKGLLSCRVDGGGWSAPAFVTITGGSVGLQIGAQATDFVLVFVDEGAVDHLFEDKFTLGGDASVSAGPVGRTAEAGTDVKLDSEILSYSRSKGAFAGISIEGAELAIDEDSNRLVYGDAGRAETLLTGSAGGDNSVVAGFVSTLERILPAHRHHGGDER